MKRLLLLSSLLAISAHAGTITGTLQGPSGLPVKNATLGFQLQQAGLLIGTGAIVPTTANCWTDTNGSVVGLPNPLTQVQTSVNYGSGNLPAGTYYVQIAYYAGSGQVTLPSPEQQVQLTSAGSLIIAPPTSFPAAASGFIAYIGTTSGGELGQGQTSAPNQSFTQSGPLSTSGNFPPQTTNSSVCTIAFNDTIIPFSGYTVSLTSSTGNAYPGWPQSWQLNGGATGTINIGAGAPQWNGVVIYPAPVLMQPLNHGPQSIAGLLNMTGYNLVNVGSLGVGTSLPSYPIDVENGQINTNLGYSIGGTAPNGHYLCGNGSVYADSSSPCTSSSGQPFYFIDFSNSFPLPQRGGNNFLPPLVATDNLAGNTTNITLNTSGVTPGSYTNLNATIDSYGRVTAASNGSGSALNIQTAHIAAGSCTATGSEQYGVCSPVSWPVAFPSSSYNTVCSYSGLPTGSGTSPGLYGPYVVGQTTTTVTVEIQSGSNAAGGTNSNPLITCIAFYPR